MKRFKLFHLKYPVSLSIQLIAILEVIYIQAPLYAETGTPSAQISEGPTSPNKTQHLCGDLPEIQLRQVTLYEQQKNSILEQFRSDNGSEEPKQLLKLAEKVFKDFIRKGCPEYLVESVFLYKTYYDQWRRTAGGKAPINNWTQREFHNWEDRIHGISDEVLTQSLIFYPRSKNLLADFDPFKNNLFREKLRVDELLKRRDRGLAISVATLVSGISLTIAGIILRYYLNGKSTGETTCISGGLPSECAYNFDPGGGVMIGFGIAMTIGGATGIGISMHQASKYSSPQSP